MNLALQKDRDSQDAGDRLRQLAWRGLILSVVLNCLASMAQAQARAEALESKPALTAEDVAAFYDGLIPAQLKRDDIAGAVIAVVKDGRVLFAKGYGYADIETRRPVSAETTLFRVGSISKLFTWTAVMQLVEEGNLDLDSDVNQYLDFQIPATYRQAITIRHLMTHTAGFQETIRHIRIRDGEQLRPLRQYLIEHLPPRIFAPGTTPAYSNYGTVLAAYIVERVTGLSFGDYVREHIFEPLDMRRSTFIQPLPESLKPMMSNGYGNLGEPAKPFDVVHHFPAAGLSATAQDIARFMIAHLQMGSLDNGRILKPETARLMHAQQIELVPGMNGIALGFAERSSNGYRVIAHSGDLWSFHSGLYLIPELGLGLFFSQNSNGRGDLRKIIWQSLLDRYFPYSRSARPAMIDVVSDVLGLAGYYKTTRRWDTSILKLNSLLSQARVSMNDDGTINVEGVEEHGKLKPLREVEPLRYCDTRYEDCIGFREDAAGKLEMVTANPYEVFQRVPWYENQVLNLSVIAASIIVFGLTLILWPIAAVVRRYYGRKLDLPVAERRRRMLVKLVLAIDLIFILSGLALYQKLYDLDVDFSPWINLLQGIGIAGAFGTLIVLYDGARCWGNRNRSWFSKVWSVAEALACLGFVWFCLIWHLFDFSTRY